MLHDENSNTFTFEGVEYDVVPNYKVAYLYSFAEPTEHSFWCLGCAGINNNDICDAFECHAAERPEGQQCIIVKKA